MIFVNTIVLPIVLYIFNDSSVNHELIRTIVQTCFIDTRGDNNTANGDKQK